jgi:hypothetical protein
MSGPVERRASSRLIAVKNQAHLERATARGRRKVAARLVNISRDGALLATGEASPLGEPLCVRLDSPVRTDWVAAVAVRPGRPGEVALQFARGCADDLLLAATLGIDLSPMITDLVQPFSGSDEVAI